MVQGRRTRQQLLIECDPESLQAADQQAKLEQREQAAALSLRPVEQFRYPETIPEDFGADSDAEHGGASCSVDVFSLNYDHMTLAQLEETVLKIISTDTVKQLREERDRHYASVKDAAQKVEYYLDAIPSASTAAASDPTDIGYMYSTMLTRIFQELDLHNESSARAGRNKIPTPKLESVGKKKTCIVNFQRICQAISRPVEDVKEFLEKELSVKGNLDANEAFTLKYQMQKSTDLDKLLQRYLDVYVKCNSCNRIDTQLVRNGRLVELRCNFCTATRTVTQVTSATYNAVVERRARTRANMTL